MTKIYFYNICLLVFFYSCVANKSQPSEQPLFPGTQEGKWWIVNSISKDSEGKDLHFCALIGTEQVYGKYYAANFVSIWEEKTGNYYSGFQQSENIKIKRGNTFPVSISAVDSTGYLWNWEIKRNRMQFFASVKNSNDSFAKPSLENVETIFAKQIPFQVSQINNMPGIWVVKQIPAAINFSGAISAKGAGELCLNVFMGKALLLDKAANSFVTWMDISITPQKHLGLLLRTDHTGSVNVETAFYRDENKQINYKPVVTVNTKAQDYFKSSVSEKIYPLIYTINVPSEKLLFEVRPRIKQQEMNNKKMSFWMGAVEVMDLKAGNSLGAGNMYIFKK